MSQQLHEVRFVWPHEAKNVIVMGSYDNWSSNTRLNKGPRGWEAVVMVKWDTKILYKFVVDGRWAISDSAPTETDWSGNLNNVYYSPRNPAEGTAESPATGATEAATSTVSAVVGTVQAGVTSVAQAAQAFSEKVIDQSAVTPIATPAANADKPPVLNGTAVNGSATPTSKLEEAQTAFVKAANGVAEQTKAAIPESLVADKPPPVPAETADPASGASTTRSPNMPIVPLGHPTDAGTPAVSTSVPETTLVPGAAVAAAGASTTKEASTHAPVNFSKGATSPPVAEDKPLVPEVKEAGAPITEAKPAPAPPVVSAPTPDPASTPTPTSAPVVAPVPVSAESIKNGSAKPAEISRPTTPKKEANGNGMATPTKQMSLNGANGTARPPPPVTPVTPQRGSMISTSDTPDTPVSTKSTKSSKYDSTGKRSSFFGKIKHMFQGDDDKKDRKHSRSVSGSSRS